MSWYTRLLTHVITHWTAGTPDGFGGYTYTAQVLDGRWRKEEEIFYDDAGAEQRSTSVVYLAQSVNNHDWLAKGDHSSTSDPTTVAGAAEIQAVRETDSLDNRVTVFKALLQEGGQS